MRSRQHHTYQSKKERVFRIVIFTLHLVYERNEARTCKIGTYSQKYKNGKHRIISKGTSKSILR